MFDEKKPDLSAAFPWVVFDVHSGRDVAVARTESEAIAMCSRMPRYDYEAI